MILVISHHRTVHGPTPCVSCYVTPSSGYASIRQSDKQARMLVCKRICRYSTPTMTPCLSKSHKIEAFFSSLFPPCSSGENRPDQQQPPLSIFTVLDESLCITITFPACLRASTSGRDEKKKESERRGEEGGWRMKYAPAAINVQQRNLPVALP